MKRNITSTIAIAALTLSSAAFAQAQNATATPAAAAAAATPAVAPTGVNKIAIIDIQRAIVNTNEGKRDFEALQKKFDPRQSELKTQNDEIERLKKDLSAQTDKLSEPERAQRVQAIEAKQKLLQRNMEDAQNDYQQQSNEVANRIGGKMLEVMDKFARQNGIGVVMDVSGQQNNVLWGSEQANITAAVVDAYNASSGVAAPPPSSRPSAGATRPSAPRPSTGAATTPRPATGATTGAATTPKH